MNEKIFYSNIEKSAHKTGSNLITYFADFLSFVIAGHSHTIRIKTENYSKHQWESFNSLYKDLIMLNYEMIVKGGKKWFDPLGEFFEIHSSKSSRDMRGQFFTPDYGCDLMVLINKPEKEGSNILDPACGSGRLSIASHAHYPQNFHYAMDLDRTCCLMTAVNMMLHGCRGEVVWKNSLDSLDFKEGWSINPRIILLKGLPHIEELKKEKSFIYLNGLSHDQNKKEEFLSLQENISRDFFSHIKDDNKIIVNNENTMNNGFDLF